MEHVGSQSFVCYYLPGLPLLNGTQEFMSLLKKTLSFTALLSVTHAPSSDDNCVVQPALLLKGWPDSHRGKSEEVFPGNSAIVRQ